MRVLEAREPGLMEIETTLVTTPHEWVQDAPAGVDEMGASPDGFVQMEWEVFPFVDALGGDMDEKNEIKKRARSWFAGFRHQGLQELNETRRAIFRLVPAR